MPCSPNGFLGGCLTAYASRWLAIAYVPRYIFTSMLLITILNNFPSTLANFLITIIISSRLPLLEKVKRTGDQNYLIDHCIYFLFETTIKRVQQML